MKRFGFSLDEELHSALRARAEEEKTSMAAICREALFLHLQNPLEFTLAPREDTTSPHWNRLKQQVRQYLEEAESQETARELEELLGPCRPIRSGAPRSFQPEETPDLLTQTRRETSPEWYAFPVKFGPDGLCLRGFHHSGIDRCERPFTVPGRHGPDTGHWFQWH